MQEFELLRSNAFSLPDVAYNQSVKPISNNSLTSFLQDVNKFADEIKLNFQLDIQGILHDLNANPDHLGEPDTYRKCLQLMADLWNATGEHALKDKDRDLFCRRFIKYMEYGIFAKNWVLKLQQTTMPYLYKYNLRSLLNTFRFDILIETGLKRSKVFGASSILGVAHDKKLITPPLIHTEVNFEREVYKELCIKALHKNYTPIAIFRHITIKLKELIQENGYKGSYKEGYSESFCKKLLYGIINPLLSTKHKIDFNDFIIRNNSLDSVQDAGGEQHLLQTKSNNLKSGAIIDIDLTNVVLKLYQTLDDECFSLDESSSVLFNYLLDKDKKYDGNYQITHLKASEIFTHVLEEIYFLYNLIEPKKQFQLISALTSETDDELVNLDLALNFVMQNLPEAKWQVLAEIWQLPASEFSLFLSISANFHQVLSLIPTSYQVEELENTFSMLVNTKPKLDNLVKITSLNTTDPRLVQALDMFWQHYLLENVNNLLKLLIETQNKNLDKVFLTIFQKLQKLAPNHARHVFLQNYLGHNILMEFVRHAPSLVPDLLTLIKTLGLKLEGTILAENINDKLSPLFGATALLIAAENNNPKASIALIKAIAKLPLPLQVDIMKARVPAVFSHNGVNAFLCAINHCPSFVVYEFLELIKNFDRKSQEEIFSFELDGESCISTIYKKHHNIFTDVLDIVSKFDKDAKIKICNGDIFAEELLDKTSEKPQSRSINCV